jgi:hypothetical protein
MGGDRADVDGAAADADNTILDPLRGRNLARHAAFRGLVAPKER